MNSRFLAQVACIWEVTARKVGNVHPSAAFDDMDLTTLLTSAAAVQWIAPRTSYGGSIGGLINVAVRSTREAVGTNTNLGIILALAPLVVAHYRAGSLRHWTIHHLRHVSIEDTRLVYEAIRLANPGGLGKVPEQDVRDEPTVTLIEAMKLAADRDLIARQYVNDYVDVFDFGVPAFLDGLEQFGCVEAAIIHCQLRWLAKFPDSLIARKNSTAVAEKVRRQAAQVLWLGGLATTEGRAAGVALDQHLRSQGNKLNPGTTADLVAACLFVALRENEVKPSAPFRWDVPDWLSP